MLPRSRLDKVQRTLARGVLALVALGAPCIACSSDRTDPEPELHPLSPDEIALRAKLGVPRDAKKVMVFSQTAHLDIDWQKTFDEYYASFVGDVLTEAGVILKTQPRAFYSVAEMAYLEHHLATHPDEIPVWRDAAQRGALRIVGGGMTTPDTLRPETELLFRDYLYGIQFAEERLGAHPRAAWLPDDENLQVPGGHIASFGGDDPAFTDGQIDLSSCARSVRQDALPLLLRGGDTRAGTRDIAGVRGRAHGDARGGALSADAVDCSP